MSIKFLQGLRRWIDNLKAWVGRMVAWVTRVLVYTLEYISLVGSGRGNDSSREAEPIWISRRYVLKEIVS